LRERKPIVATGAPRRAISRGWRGRYNRPPRRRQARRDVGPAGLNRESRRRGRQYRIRSCRTFSIGWLLYTLYLAGEFHSTNLYTYPKLNYDPVADFAPVSLVVHYPTIIVVPNSSPAKTLKEFIAHAKANDGKLTMATSGYGTGPHLAAELFKRLANVQLTHVAKSEMAGWAPVIKEANININE